MAEGGPSSTGGLAGPAQQGRPTTTQQNPVGRPTSPSLSISPPPPANSKAMLAYVAAPLTTGSVPNFQIGGTWPYGKPWPVGAAANNQGHHSRRASIGCDVNRDAVSDGPSRSKGTRKVTVGIFFTLLWCTQAANRFFSADFTSSVLSLDSVKDCFKGAVYNSPIEIDFVRDVLG